MPNIDRVIKVYNARLEECKKAREHCDKVIQIQKKIILEIRNGNATLGSALENYLEINQQILQNLSNIVYKNERDHAVIIAMLMSHSKNTISSEEVLDKILKTFDTPDQNINILTKRDANLTEINRRK